jgi:DNA mismatch endonuclease, patch repair protein
MTGSESWASTPGRRRNMQAIRSRDTAPELAVRRLLHARGLRYRIDVQPDDSLRRRADIVFTRQRIAVFIDGCFWHGCPQHGRTAFQHNTDYWPDKIRTNRARDADTNDRLAAVGWRVLRFWEHDDPLAVADRIAEVVALTRQTPGERSETADSSAPDSAMRLARGRETSQKGSTAPRVRDPLRSPAHQAGDAT